MKFDVNTRFDMRQLGCGPYKYFCVEFGKDSLAVPDFYMPLSNGDVSVSCQRSVCPEGKYMTRPKILPTIMHVIAKRLRALDSNSGVSIQQSVG